MEERAPPSQHEAIELLHEDAQRGITLAEVCRERGIEDPNLVRSNLGGWPEAVRKRLGLQ